MAGKKSTQPNCSTPLKMSEAVRVLREAGYPLQSDYRWARAAVRRLAQANKLPHRRLPSRRLVFYEAELVAWVEEWRKAQPAIAPVTQSVCS